MSPLNKQKGNMYGWCTHTWNPIKGKCPHECIYCYMKGKPVGELRLDEKEFRVKLGSGKTIFVGSGTDMWAKEVPNEWIIKAIQHCRNFNNLYLFQSKNPDRFSDFTGLLRRHFTILGTTIETNRELKDFSKAPNPWKRYMDIGRLKYYDGFKIMVSIEPIMDFDPTFIDALKELQASFISIGADSKGHNLPEPSPEKIRELIAELKKFTEVKIKSNLNRLLSRKEKTR